MPSLKLLPEHDLLVTGPVDHADWNYRPLLAPIARRRFRLILDLMPPRKVQRLLEVGYGSGIFMPELALRCEELYGIDVHDRFEAVRERLQTSGVIANLSRQDAASTDFPSEFFDAIVAVSAIEFIERIEDAARELARILTPGGRLLMVMPNSSPVLDAALRVTTGESANRDYGDRRKHVLPALERYFKIVRIKRFGPVYLAYHLERQTPVASAASRDSTSARGELRR
jgi:ubiquinone/menaquinone biosynthesis C-methylase UbiE